MRRKIIQYGLALGITLGSQGGVHAQDFPYAIFELETLGGEDSYAKGLTETGDVLGSAYVGTEGAPACVWVGGLGVPINIGSLGGRLASAHAANSDGWIVGRSNIPGGSVFDNRAFLWRDGTMTDLGTFGGDHAEAWDINEAGHIAGWAEIVPGQSNPRHACLWIDGEIIDLGTLDSTVSEARAMNNHGIVVGQAVSEAYQSSWRAFRWENGEMRDLGTLTSDNRGQSWAYDIDDFGNIVGGADIDTRNKRNAFVWFDDQLIDLGRLPGTNAAYANSINNQGQIVGTSIIQFFNSYAFIWEQSEGMRSLGDLIAPLSGWRARTAWAINEAGQIAGHGTRNGDNDTTVGFLLTPVNPTMDLLSPQPGIAGEVNSLSVTDITPGQQVDFYYSRQGGGAAIPSCDLQENALQMEDPKFIGTAVANGDGIATVMRYVPTAARDQWILMQAVVPGECAISRLAVWRFE